MQVDSASAGGAAAANSGHEADRGDTGAAASAADRDAARSTTPPSTVAQESNVPSRALREMANDPSPYKPTSTTSSDQTTVVPASATVNAAGKAAQDAGTNRLVRNPELHIQWESTRSAWNGSGGFSQPLKDDLRAGGIGVADNVRPTPLGSIGRNAGVSSGTANNHNGRLAENAIADEYRRAGLQATTQHRLPEYNRRVDVKVDIPHASDPRLNQELRIESKATYTHAGSPRVASEMPSDLRQLADNRAVRATGFALEKVGKVARPVGLAVDAFQLGSAFHADGNRFGERTQHAAASLAGGAVGGVAGAVIGQALIPIPGVGAVVGAAIGSWLGSKVGEGLLSGIKSIF